MSDPKLTKEAAKETLNRLRDRVEPRLTNMQSRVQTLPQKLRPASVSSSAFYSADRNLSAPALSPSAPTPSPPPPGITRATVLSDDMYSPTLAHLADRILYRSGRCPLSSGPLLILSAAAFPDAQEVDYTKLLPYVLANLPGEQELAGTDGYSVVFFAGGGKDGGKVTNWAWTLQAYGMLGRAVRKKIRRLWIVHERAWVRVVFEVLAGVVSSKFRKKVVHCNTLTDLAASLDISQLIIPPAVYVHNRKMESEVTLPGFPPPPVFGVKPFGNKANPPKVGDATPLPQVLLDTSNYIRASCLQTEGLFRIPPSQAWLEIVQGIYDRHQTINWPDWGPHTAAGLIKLYYRLLPEAPLPITCYNTLFQLSPPRPSPTTAERLRTEEEKEAQFELVRELLTGEDSPLPPWSRILLLRHLLPLLSVIAEHKAENKMTPQNLAVCVAGSLVRSNDVVADAKAGGGVRKLVEIGIERIEELAPKLPIRRHKPHVERKKVPSLSIGKPTAVARKPVTGELTESPLAQSPTAAAGRSSPIARKPVPMAVGRQQSLPSPSPVTPLPSAIGHPIKARSFDDHPSPSPTPASAVLLPPPPPPPTAVTAPRKPSLPTPTLVTPALQTARAPALRRSISSGGIVAQRRRSFVQMEEEGKDERPIRAVRRVKSSFLEGEKLHGGEVGGRVGERLAPGAVGELRRVFEERARGVEALKAVGGKGRD